MRFFYDSNINMTISEIFPRHCLKGIASHVCRLRYVCAITYILIWDFHLTRLHKTHFYDLKKFHFTVVNASAFSVIFSLSTIKRRRRRVAGAGLYSSSNIHHTWNLFSISYFPPFSLPRMKSKFFIKYLTRCRNADVIAYHVKKRKKNRKLPSILSVYCVQK